MIPDVIGLDTFAAAAKALPHAQWGEIAVTYDLHRQHGRPPAPGHHHLVVVVAHPRPGQPAPQERPRDLSSALQWRDQDPGFGLTCAVDLRIDPLGQVVGWDILPEERVIADYRIRASTCLEADLRAIAQQVWPLTAPAPVGVAWPEWPPHPHPLTESQAARAAWLQEVLPKVRQDQGINAQGYGLRRGEVYPNPQVCLAAYEADLRALTGGPG